MRFVNLGLLAVVAACGGGSAPNTTPAATGSDVTVVVGAVWTGHDDAPRAESFAFRGGEIIAVGLASELTAAYPQAKRIDAGPGLVIPGVVDSHVHIAELGAKGLVADLVGTTTVDDMVARLRARYPDPPPGQWVRGAGWDEGAWASAGYPDRRALDAAFPDNPVALRSLHGFAGFYNARALELAGIDTNTANPEGGTILRRDDGEATGVLLTLAQGLIDARIPRPSVDDHKKAITLGLETVRAAGVTSVHEAGMSAERVRAFEQLAAEGRLPVRVYGMLDGNDTALMNAWFDRGPRADDPWFAVRSIKVFYDGSLGSRTALLTEPYADRPDAARPTERIRPADMRSLAVRARDTGFQLAVHAIGDEANQRVIDLYEDLFIYTLGHRWRIEHAQVVAPDYFWRAARLGVISSMQPSHAVGDSDWAEERVGSERIQRAYAWQSILAAGGRLIFNSDLPGEPWTPIETLWFAVTRAKLDAEPESAWYPDQAVSVDRALRAMTIDGAHAAFQEELIGSIAAGKRADFVILSANPFSVPVRELKDIEVAAVFVDGQRADQE